MARSSDSKGGKYRFEKINERGKIKALQNSNGISYTAAVCYYQLQYITQVLLLKG